MEFNFVYKNGFTPTEMEDISKCLENIFSIPAGSIPLSRRLGLEWVNLSQNPENMENDYAVEIVEKVEEFEPRVSVSDVAFSHDADGMAQVIVHLEKGRGDGMDDN